MEKQLKHEELWVLCALFITVAGHAKLEDDTWEVKTGAVGPIIVCPFVFAQFGFFQLILFHAHIHIFHRFLFMVGE